MCRERETQTRCLYEGGRVVNGRWRWGGQGPRVGWWRAALMSLSPRRVAGIWRIGVLVRRCMSKMSRQAARRKGAPAGAKGWLRVSMCQIDSVSRRARSIWATLGAALAAEPALGVLVALGVVGVLARVQGGLEQRPAQVLGAVLGDRAAGVDCAGLAHRGHRPV